MGNSKGEWKRETSAAWLDTTVGRPGRGWKRREGDLENTEKGGEGQGGEDKKHPKRDCWSFTIRIDSLFAKHSRFAQQQQPIVTSKAFKLCCWCLLIKTQVKDTNRPDLSQRTYKGYFYNLSGLVSSPILYTHSVCTLQVCILTCSWVNKIECVFFKVILF